MSRSLFRMFCTERTRSSRCPPPWLSRMRSRVQGVARKSFTPARPGLAAPRSGRRDRALRWILSSGYYRNARKQSERGVPPDVHYVVARTTASDRNWNFGADPTSRRRSRNERRGFAGRLLHPTHLASFSSRQACRARRQVARQSSGRTNPKATPTVEPAAFRR
jgi:hypothetical protein